jgi:peptidoglycan L-alanyl-D-glutamate endopeptidase CwlK
MPNFSKKSDDKLKTCDIRLQILFNQVVKKYDCIVIEGHRSIERQEELFNDKNRKTKVKHSKHNEKPSLAIDISPYPIPDKWGEGDSKEKSKFYHFAGYVKGMAEANSIKIRWGGDWDNDNDFNDQTFDDLVHFELIGV